MWRQTINVGMQNPGIENGDVILGKTSVVKNQQRQDVSMLETKCEKTKVTTSSIRVVAHGDMLVCSFSQRGVISQK